MRGSYGPSSARMGYAVFAAGVRKWLYALRVYNYAFTKRLAFDARLIILNEVAFEIAMHDGFLYGSACQSCRGRGTR